MPCVQHAHRGTLLAWCFQCLWLVVVLLDEIEEVLRSLLLLVVLILVHVFFVNVVLKQRPLDGRIYRGLHFLYSLGARKKKRASTVIGFAVSPG